MKMKTIQNDRSSLNPRHVRSLLRITIEGTCLIDCSSIICKTTNKTKLNNNNLKNTLGWLISEWPQSREYQWDKAVIKQRNPMYWQALSEFVKRTKYKIKRTRTKQMRWMRCAIWYHLHNLKKVKNAHGGVLILVKLQAKLTLLHGCFSRFLNCINSTKSRKASQMMRHNLVPHLRKWTIVRFPQTQCNKLGWLKDLNLQDGSLFKYKKYHYPSQQLYVQRYKH